jgi:hypothetical protein
MREPCHEQGFALEAVAEFRLGGHVVVHDLDDHLAAEVELSGQVDFAHPPLAEEAQSFIPAQEDAAYHANRSSGPVGASPGVLPEA